MAWADDFGAVLDAFDPLIRADEAVKVLGTDYAWVIRMALGDLRAQVEALPGRGLEVPYDTGAPHTMVWRDEVLALLDGADL